MTLKQKKLLIILPILISLISCSTAKGPYSYAICVAQEADSSLFISDELIGIADTTVAVLSGQVFDLDTKETLHFARVILKEAETDKSYGQITDSLGRFVITVPANEYEFEVRFIGRSSIKKDLTLGTGEMREVKIELGQGGSYVTYGIESEKRLSKRQIRKKAEELKAK